MPQSQLKPKQSNFIEKYITIGAHRKDPVHIAKRIGAAKRKLLKGQAERGNPKLDPARQEAALAAVIAARKEIAHIERHRLMAELASLAVVSMPTLAEVERDDPIVRHIVTIYKDFKSQINAVDDTQSEADARSALEHIEADMKRRFDEIYQDIVADRIGAKAAEAAAGPAKVIWKGDMGKALTAKLGPAGRFIAITDAPMEVRLNGDFLAHLEKDGDKITPMALQQEVALCFDQSVAMLSGHFSDIVQRAELLEREGKADRLSDLQMEDHLREGLEQFEDHVRDTLRPMVVDEANRLRDQIASFLEIRWAQVATRRDEMKMRPLKLGLKFTLPIVGVVVGGLGIAAAIVFSASGIGLPAGIGIGFASLAIIRGTFSAGKSAYGEIRSLKRLTEKLKHDVEKLAAAYKIEYGRSADEIGAAVINAVSALPLINALPGIKTRMEELEIRLAVIQDSQRKLMAHANKAIETLQGDIDLALKDVDPKDKAARRAVEAGFAAAGADVDVLLSKISELGEKVLPVQESFGRLKAAVGKLDALISSGVQDATTAIPIITDILVAVGSLLAGVGGVITAASGAEAACGTALTSIGAVNDASSIGHAMDNA